MLFGSAAPGVFTAPLANADPQLISESTVTHQPQNHDYRGSHFRPETHSLITRSIVAHRMACHRNIVGNGPVLVLANGVGFRPQSRHLMPPRKTAIRLCGYDVTSWPALGPGPDVQRLARNSPASVGPAEETHLVLIRCNGHESGCDKTQGYARWHLRHALLWQANNLVILCS